MIAALGDAGARLPHDLADRLKVALTPTNEDSASPQRAFHDHADLAASMLAELLQVLHASERVRTVAASGQPLADSTREHLRLACKGLPAHVLRNQPATAPTMRQPQL